MGNQALNFKQQKHRKMNIEIQIQVDPNTKEEWHFYLFDLSFVLDKYFLLKKENKERKLRVSKKWLRLSSRDSNMDQPTIPEHVKVLALREAQERIKICSREEYNKK